MTCQDCKEFLTLSLIVIVIILVIVFSSPAGLDPPRRELTELLHNVVAHIILRVTWEAFRLHCATGPCEGCEKEWPSQRDHQCMGYPLPEDDDVLIEHLSAARRHLNQPAILGVYMDLLRHLNLCPRILQIEPMVLMDAILDEFEEDPLLVIPYNYGCEQRVTTFLLNTTGNLEHFCRF